MSPARAKLFTHGGSQAVRLPRAFRFEGSEVKVSREGRRIVLEPVEDEDVDWSSFWAEIDSLGGGEFPDRAPQPSAMGRWRPD